MSLLINKLLNNFFDKVDYSNQLLSKIHSNQFTTHALIDHIAIIDITSKYSGIDFLSSLFELIDYKHIDRGYLEEKQNHFAWMRNNQEKSIYKELPQIIVADFELDALSNKVRDIINKYTSTIEPVDFNYLKNLDISQREETIFNILNNRTWNTPSLHDYLAIKEENELLSWVLAWGRRINHIGISVYKRPDQFDNLGEFNDYVSKNFPLTLKKYHDSSTIAGSELDGIMQSSHEAEFKVLNLSDDKIEITDGFVEFVWRVKKDQNLTGKLSTDYYQDYIGYNANQVVESVLLENVA